MKNRIVLVPILLLVAISLGFNKSNSIYLINKPKPNYIEPIKAYTPYLDSLRYDSLFTIYGNDKVLPKGYEIQAIVALSHYPELKNANIEFRFKKAKISHTSRPKMGSLFLGKKNRKYVITISTQVKESLEEGRLENLSYNAQIGVIGHELAHVVDYKNRNFFNIVGFGIKYTKEKNIIEIENNTDVITINHGLGYQLLEWSREVHEILETDGRGERYLKPQKIISIISTHPLYNKS